MAAVKHCPCGVISWDGKIICYERVPRIIYQVQDGAAGGTLRIPVVSGTVLQACELGVDPMEKIPPELYQAIAADMEKRGVK